MPGSVQSQPPGLPPGNLQSSGDDDTGKKKIKGDTERKVLSMVRVSAACSVRGAVIY